MSIQKSEAILLSRRDLRETSVIALFYTKEFGKIKGLLKGVRGAQAKFGIYLHEFAKYDIIFYEKSRSDTYMVTQCDLKDDFSEIAQDLDKRARTYYLLELIDKFTPLLERVPEIYCLLVWMLEYIQRERFTDKATIIFQLKLLQFAGFLPQLSRCVECSSKELKDAYFSVRLSGLLCESCRSSDVQAWPISKGAVSTINMIRSRSIEQLKRPVITGDIAKELKRLTDKFITYHLGEHLKTNEFLRQIDMLK